MNLEALQRAMAAAVMQPLTADEGMRVIAADGRPMDAVAASFIAPNSRLSAFERLQIYNRQYWFRVLGGLAEDFVALRALVGAEPFEALSIAYLKEHPNRSFTLRNLGSKLVEWLSKHPEYAGRRHSLAIDVARIEWEFIEAFDSADREPLSLAHIAALDGGSRLSLQPHLRLLALNYPADNLVLALHDREKRQASEAGVKHEDLDGAPGKLPRVRRRPTWLAAHRVDLSVYYRRLDREEFLMLAAIREGLTLGAAIEAAWEASLIPQERRAVKIQEWFSVWAQLGWICAPEA